MAPCPLRGVSAAEKEEARAEGEGEEEEGVEEIEAPAPRQRQQQRGPAPPPAPPLDLLLLPSAPSLLALDLLDHTVLGLGLLDAVDDAARRGLVDPGGGTRLLPGRVRVCATVVVAPLKLAGGSGAPARVFAFVPAPASEEPGTK